MVRCGERRLCKDLVRIGSAYALGGWLQESCTHCRLTNGAASDEHNSAPWNAFNLYRSHQPRYVIKPDLYTTPPDFTYALRPSDLIAWHC